MQKHYENVVRSIESLKSTIQGSSLNREEYDNAWGMLKHIEEQVLPLTLTWVPKDKEPAEEPIQKKVFKAFGVPFKEQLEKLKLK